MKRVSDWSHLEPFGLIFLTAEACALGHRLLLDCTEEGRALLARAFGVRSLALAEPWNAKSPAGVHVGSVMLPQSLFPTLAVFALLENGCTECWLCPNGTVIGFEPTDTRDDRDQTARLLRGEAVRTFAYRGETKDRNRHLFTGRTA